MTKSSTPDSSRMKAAKGFTLLEVLVSLALLGLALVMIFQLFSSGLKTVAAAEDYASAVIKAEAAMRAILEDEDIREKSWSETTRDGYRINATVEKAADDRTENLTVEMLKISLTVHWTIGSKERSINLKSLKLVNKQI